MASSSCLRAAARSPLLSLRSHLLKTKKSPSAPLRSSAPPRRRPLSSRSSAVEVARSCSSGPSLLPLHSAVAAARMTSRLSSTSRSCRALSQGTLCRTSPGL